MPWDGRANSYAGFSEGKPWLPMQDAHSAASVATQEDDPESVLSFYKQAIALRKRCAALRYGTISFDSEAENDPDLLVFDRTLDGLSRRCVFNLGRRDLVYFGPQDGELHVGDLNRGASVPPYSGWICPLR